MTANIIQRKYKGFNKIGKTRPNKKIDTDDNKK